MLPVQEKGRYSHLYVQFWMIALGFGLFGILLSRPVLQDGTLHLPWAETMQFIYPLTVTLSQLSVTAIFLLTGAIFTALLDRLFFYGSHQRERANSITTAPFENFSSIQQHQDRRFGFLNRRYWFFQLVCLAGSIAGDAVFGARLLFHYPVEVYVLSRGLTIPLFWLVTLSMPKTNTPALTSHTICCSIFLFVGSIASSCRPRLSHMHNQFIWETMLSALFTVVSMMQIEQMSRLQGHNEPLKEQYQLIAIEDGELGAGDARPVSCVSTTAAAALSLDLKTLFLLPFAAALGLAPVLVLSGELGHIYRNCYFLNEPDFWGQLMYGGISRFLLFTGTTILIHLTSVYATVTWSAFASVGLMLLFKSASLAPSQMIGVSCCAFSAAYYSLHVLRSSHTSSASRVPELSWRNVKFICAGAIIVTSLLLTSYTGYLSKQETSEEISSFLPMTNGSQGYLGNRPSSNSHVNFTAMAENCRGAYQNLELIDDYQRCLDYLSSKQDEYLYVPDTVSTTNVLERSNHSLAPSKRVCDGPIIPYHIWWTGAPSWRIELFIKSYLFTQNLACSRLWIWVNTDYHEDSMDLWKNSERFQKFHSFLEGGDIVLKGWKLPSRVPLTQDIDDLDRARYYRQHGAPNAKGEVKVADSVVRDAAGQEWLILYEGSHQITYFTVAVSDAARLIILHLHGGVYIDVDMILLRDLRPLLLPEKPFAERWGPNQWYNNALVALSANSSMSSYILRGGARMGLVYHFKALSRMLLFELRGDNHEPGLAKIENAFFDPAASDKNTGIVPRYDCPVPCFVNFESIFQADPIVDEWIGFHGEPVHTAITGGNNRTTENFFRGAWAYHIHNQWQTKYEPGSWMDVICTSHDRFFAGNGLNPYSESWSGPHLEQYGVL